MNQLQPTNALAVTRICGNIPKGKVHMVFQRNANLPSRLHFTNFTIRRGKRGGRRRPREAWEGGGRLQRASEGGTESCSSSSSSSRVSLGPVVVCGMVLSQWVIERSINR